MAGLILFNKPFRVLSQFRTDSDKTTLKSYINQQGYYPAGRLDYDSEGLLLLTNNGQLQHRIAHPSLKMPKRYWVLVEGLVSHGAIQDLTQGVQLRDGLTKPAKVEVIDPPDIWNREPPVRQRQHIPTSWIEITIREGRNRQVRRMTAHVGHPTLRLIRASIGSWSLDQLQPGEHRLIKVNLPQSKSRAKNFQ